MLLELRKWTHVIERHKGRLCRVVLRWWWWWWWRRSLISLFVQHLRRSVILLAVSVHWSWYRFRLSILLSTSKAESLPGFLLWLSVRRILCTVSVVGIFGLQFWLRCTLIDRFPLVGSFGISIIWFIVTCTKASFPFGNITVLVNVLVATDERRTVTVRQRFFTVQTIPARLPKLDDPCLTRDQQKTDNHRYHLHDHY